MKLLSTPVEPRARSLTWRIAAVIGFEFWILELFSSFLQSLEAETETQPSEQPFAPHSGKQPRLDTNLGKEMEKEMKNQNR